MPSNNSPSPRPPGQPRAKTERGVIQKSRQSQQGRSSNSLPRSAPAVFQPSVLDPVTPATLFLPLTVQLDGSPDDFALDAVAYPVLPPPSPTRTYFEALARLADLVAVSTLTSAQSTLLDATMNTAQYFVPPSEVHSLLHTIASPMTTPSEIQHLASVIDAGMRAFVARPGPRLGARSTTSASTTSSSSRNDLVKTACAARDHSTCVVTGKDLGLSCHIIPFSVRDDKALAFWAFVALFKGPAETQRLKVLTLGQPPSTDSIRNVLWLSPDAHTYFDSGKLALVPTVTSAAYDPTIATEYTARIELPYGPGSVKLHVWSATGEATQLASGQAITLRTADPVLLPLPHPVLLQLHTAFTRLRKMSAAAGAPILADYEEDEGEGEMQPFASEVDYQERLLLGKDLTAAPRFPENEPCMQNSGGLPLKERFLQMLAGAGDSEVQQYRRVIDRWSPGMRGKRAFERDGSGTGSERSHPARRKRPCDGSGACWGGAERE